MSNYEELISRLRSGQYEHQLDALKKLVYLSVNDQTNFKRFAIRLMDEIFTLIPDIFEQQLKLICLQLLSEIAGSYKQYVPKDQFLFQNIVPCLSDEKVEIRKSSHYMILTFVKKYQELDPILQSYENIGSSTTCPWKLAQKILHSFQSLIVVEPKCVKYSKDFSNVDSFLDFVFKKDVSDNALVKKASNQALTSFVKNQFVPQIITHLNKVITNKLIQHSKSINYFPFSDKIAKVSTKAKEQQNDDDCIEEITINFVPSVIANSNKSNNTQGSSPHSPFKKNISVEKKKEKFDSSDTSEVSPVFKKSESPLDFMIQRIHSSQPWNTKRQAVCQIYKFLASTKINSISDTLVERVLELTSDLNFTTCINSLYIIQIFIKDYFRDMRIFQQKLQDILADKICDMKMAIRQEAAKISKEIIVTYNQSRLIRILVQRVKTCSFAGKQQILKLMEDVFTNSVQQDAPFMVGQIASLLFQDNAGIKSKAMSCIVAIAESCQPEDCRNVLSKKLNKVYFDMFLEKSKELKIAKGWPTKVQSVQMETHLTANKQEIKHDNSEYSMTYTELRPNIFNKGKDKQDGVNTVSNFGSFPSTSPDQKLGVIGRKKIQEERQKQEEKERQRQKEKDKAYQYKPMLVRKTNQKVQPDMQSVETRKDSGQLIIQSKEYRGKKPSDHKKQQQFREEKKIEEKMSQQDNEQEKYTEKETYEDVQKQRDEQKSRQMEKQKQYLKVNSKPFGSKKSSSINKKEEEQMNSTSLMKKTSSTIKQPRIPDYKTTTYMSKDDIEPLAKPEGALKKLTTDIKKEEDWSLQFQSLNSIRKIIKHHKPEYTNLIQNLPAIMPEVLKLVESLRSSLAKNAMITLSEMCQAMKKQMDPYLEPIFIKLFKKGCDANSFISDQAKKSISFLCYYCTTQKAVPIILNGCQSKQSQVRALIVLMIEKLCFRSNVQPLLFLKQNIKVVSILGQYLVDSNSEVRTLTKTLILSLAVNSSKTQVQQQFKKNISDDAFNRLKTMLQKEMVNGMVVRSSSKNFDS